MTKREIAFLAYEHGKRTQGFLMSGMSERYAPLTFDSWYINNIDEEAETPNF